jgi:hypothetical protein
LWDEPVGGVRPRHLGAGRRSTTASARLTEQKPLACPRPTDGLEQLERVRVMRDLWAHTSAMTSGTVGAEVPPHAAKMFLVSSR